MALTGISSGQQGDISLEGLGLALSAETRRLLTTDPVLNIGDEDAEVRKILIIKNAAKIEATVYMYVEGMRVAENVNIYALHDGKRVEKIFREPSTDFYRYADQVPSQLLPSKRIARWRELHTAEIAAAQGSPYKLPFTEGETRVISRGGTSHSNACDFVGGDWLVRAARGGEVSRVAESFSESCYDANYTNTCHVHCSSACCNSANYVSVLHSDGSYGFYVHIRHNGVIPTEGAFINQGVCLAYTRNSARPGCGGLQWGKGSY